MPSLWTVAAKGIYPALLWSRALSNLRALQRPRWEPSSPGVLQVVSDVAYEETFLLVDEVRAALTFGADAVFAIPNRGALIAGAPGAPACRLCWRRRTTSRW
jgi:hypothetical protein